MAITAQELEIEEIPDGGYVLGPGIQTHHLAGHSPDSLAVLLAGEAIIPGDIVLPQISPWPTRLSMYDEIAKVIFGNYDRTIKMENLILPDKPILLDDGMG